MVQYAVGMPTSTPQSPELDADSVPAFFWKQPDAFNRLHQKLGPLLVYYLRSRCRNFHQAEELAQTTWTKAWSSRSTFQGGNFRAWVFQIAKNELINLYRRKKTKQISESFDIIQVIGEDKSEMLDALRECLQAVGNGFAEVLKAQLDGLSTVDIAIQLGIKEGTVGSRARRGKDELKECIEGKLI